MEAEIRHVDEVILEIGDDDFRVMDWNRDPGERSRRIHERWIKMMNGHNTKLRTFDEAVNLVVSVQPSSAARSERVFSQLSFVRRIVGDATLQDLLELRCLMRCNNDSDNDYNNECT